VHPATTPLSELIGGTGFGLVVKGESLAGRGIHDRDTVWIKPGEPCADGDLCLATTDHGLQLMTTPAAGAAIVGRVVAVTSMRML
jgi:SOS-response transcriptional repressor LexA